MSNSSQPKPATDDITPSEAEVEEISWKMAQAFGVRVDRCRAIVDQYGRYALLAFEKVQAQIAAGSAVRSPLAVMLSKLRSGEIQAEAREVVAVSSAGRRVVGTDWYVLRCPRCRGFNQFTFPKYDGPPYEAWDQKPFLKCLDCNELTPTVGWSVTIALYEPLVENEAGKRVRQRAAESVGRREAQAEALRAWQEEGATVDDEVEWLRKRWESAQSNPNLSTAQKRLGKGITLAELEAGGKSAVE